MDKFTSTFFTELKTTEVAELIGCSRQFVWLAIKAGKLMATKRKKPGRPAYYVVPGWALMAFQCDDANKLIRATLEAAKAGKLKLTSS